MSKLTHLDTAGAAHIVDVADKPATLRKAVARGRITMAPDALDAVRDASAKKGDVLAVSRIAGIMAAKQVPSLIPLCHTVALSSVAVEFALGDDGIEVVATATCTDRTGVEMEAMTAVSVALLTIYDMVKSIDRGMTIGDIRLIRKTGGKSGDWSAE